MKTGFVIAALLQATWSTASALEKSSSNELKQTTPDRVRVLGKEKWTSKPTSKPTASPTEKPTPSPTEKPTPSPTDKPTAKPTVKPTPKPTDVPTPVPKPTPKPTAKPTAKPTDEPTATPTMTPTYKPTPQPTYFCRNFVFQVYQNWTVQQLVEADGTKVNLADASVYVGLQWPFVGSSYDDVTGDVVGLSVELSERVDVGETWHTEGTYLDLYGCGGCLTFSGYYKDSTSSGSYIITGGTDTFKGATGYIWEEFDASSGLKYRNIHVF
ncbi:hypothetical protein ACA910_016589 [Epithemia clementina (nom. ined.)]